MGYLAACRRRARSAKRDRQLEAARRRSQKIIEHIQHAPERPLKQYHYTRRAPDAYSSLAAARGNCSLCTREILYFAAGASSISLPARREKSASLSDVGIASARLLQWKCESPRPERRRRRGGFLITTRCACGGVV